MFIIDFLKLAKNSRVRFRNAWNIRRNLMSKGQSVDLAPTPYYDSLSLRPNFADWIAFEQVFRYLCYGGLEKMGPFRTVIDAGANIGLSAVFFSKRLGAPQIVALEPEENNFKQAVYNTQTLPNVEVLGAALWPRQEPLYISNQETSGSLGFQVKTSTEAPGAAIFKTVTIPEIMQKRGWQTLDLLKIDIEGAEKDLFEEPLHEEWLGRVRVLVIELHDWLRPGCSSAFFRAVAKLDNIEMSLSGENIIILNNNVRSAQ